MTEQEWLTSVDPWAMLQHVRGKVSDRRLRLWAYHHWCKNNQHLRHEFDQMYQQCLSKCEVSSISHRLAMIEDCYHDQEFACHLLREVCGNPFRYWGRGPSGIWTDQPGGQILAVPDSVLTPTVLAIASVIDTEQRWQDMPYLADALEEAGCDNEEILWHLRGFERCTGNHSPGSTYQYSWGMKLLPCKLCDPHVDEPNGIKPSISRGWMPLRGPHVRGCWVIDLLREK